MKNRYGFSLIELMVVIAVISILAAVSVPVYKNFLTRSKRSEAYANLHSLYIAEQAYHAEHSEFTTQLRGENSLGWEPSGKNAYTYGFGSGPDSSVVGTLKTPASALSNTQASKDSFIAGAAGDIDGDSVNDVLTIDEKGTITIVTDDTKDQTAAK
jgi:prepilin-type N-terminal cleavage/methylation domain-containing protein